VSKGRIAQQTVFFSSDIKKVWEAVTNNLDYGWRTDIKSVEILPNGKDWIEYYDNGKFTNFILKKKIEYSEYIFEMENPMFTGFWTGYFYELESGGTKAVFTENIFIKNPIIRVISYLFWDLKKIQNVYIRDLKNKLGEETA